MNHSLYIQYINFHNIAGWPMQNHQTPKSLQILADSLILIPLSHTSHHCILPPFIDLPQCLSSLITRRYTSFILSTSFVSICSYKNNTFHIFFQLFVWSYHFIFYFLSQSLHSVWLSYLLTIFWASSFFFMLYHCIILHSQMASPTNKCIVTTLSLAMIGIWVLIH